MKAVRVLASLLIDGLFSLAIFNSPANAQTPAVVCSPSGNPEASSAMTICFTSPNDGASLTGDVPVAVTAVLSNGSDDIQNMVFSLNTEYLLTDYTSPFLFTLPTEKWADGRYTISVIVHMRQNTKTMRAQTTVNFNNGNAKAPVNTNHFSPNSGTSPVNGQPFVVAASGDGASGEANSSSVISTVSSLNPNLFLYLGDVYESGSKAEFYNWYGSGSANFSVLRAITDPTIGNHEYTNGVGGAGYFDYWDNIPNYYSFNAGGWHFISLNANLAKLGGNPPGVVQYYWLAHDLSANAQTCSIVYYHEPLFNIGAEGPNEAMMRFWALLANYKVPIVLNGHDHDYQRWVPLDGSGNPSPTGITEFVAGGGGHGLNDFITTDSRVAYSNNMNPIAFGVLLLQLSSTGANYSYHSSDGSILDSGFIPCVSAGSTNSSTANGYTPTLAATATLVVSPTSSPAPSATAFVTDSPFPSTTAAGMNPPAFVATPVTTPIPASTQKAPAFSGGIAFGSIVILIVLTGIIIFVARRHV
jgi:hypothetical protein